MGGVKNRDAKMKANKVFSSGGGGGTKGPAVVDKRGQEVKCPYCDKVYQQSGRLKDHIAKQHAEQLQPTAETPAAGGSGSSSATAGASGDGASSSAANAPNVVAAAAVAARHAAAAATGKGPAAALNTLVGATSASTPASAASGGSAAGAGGSGGMMQVNSRAGYYTCKSPSMHVHEWVQKLKRRRALYHPRQLEDGRWTCKVVLPDEKRREDDIVVFLDEKYSADDEQQARERAAVAALHRVQGDRALERILPREFVSMWTELGEQRKEREQRVAERRVADARRKQGEEERRRKANLRKPQVVVMSAAKQRLVQALLRDRAGAGVAATPGSVAADEGDLSAVVDQLSTMGFSPQHVQLAYERSASTAPAGGSGGSVSLEVLLDWLLVHLPSDQLPEQFTQGSGTNSVNIVARSEPGLQSVARLMSYGFTSGECEVALRAAGGDELVAHLRLYGDLTGVQLQGRPGGGGDGDSWAEEMMVLESIYDSQFSVVSENVVRLSLELPEECSVATRADAPLVLEFVRLSGGDGGEGDGGGEDMSYPNIAPLVSVSCAGLAAGALRHLTCVLAQESQQLLGQAALHDLAVRVLEAAAAMDEQTCTAAEAGSRTAAWRHRGAAADWEDAATEGDGESSEWGLERQDSSLVEGFEGLTVEDEEDEGGTEEGSEGTASERRSGGAPGRARGGSTRARQVPQEHRRRQRSQVDVAAESARLARLQSDLESSAVHAAMRAVRRALPAFAKRGELLELLAGNDVVVVSGATGCGKSTQVPQYILEDAISSGMGAKCNIVVTQPRRISALGLASRVASERGESVGAVVGYSVRLEHRVSAATRLTFVTTGILLRRLLSDPDLEGTTHIVLDEVHERSIEIDLLLLLLRDVLLRRRTAAAAAMAPPPAPLKLILMSATADAKLFADYMTTKTTTATTTVAAAAAGHQRNGGKARRDGTAAAACGTSSVGSVGTMTIPGFTFPVREFYLEDVFELTGHVVGQSSKYTRRGGGGGGKGQRSGKGEEPQALPPLSQALPSYSQTTLRSLENVDESQINYDLLVDLVALIVERHKQDGAAAFLSDWPQAFSSGRGDVSGGGAILVFLPGAPEINRMQRTLLQSGKVLAAAGGRGNLRVLPLHGSLSSADQSRVFARPPAGCVKVVLATNVAETSITIDDVTVVVDAGRVKEMSHDPERGIMRLQEVWVSKAASQQRRGRAGRVRPGICFRLFSTQQWGLMPNHTEPEMLRSPLESVCLLIKGMAAAAAAAAAAAEAGVNGGVNAFLSRCLSPPSSKAVTSAVQLLRTIGAFDVDEALTSLGRHLNKMPMDPRVGKALVYGCMLGCLDPVLTVTAAMAHGRPVFLNLQNAEDGVAAARRQLLRPVAASKSDHLAVVATYNAWCKAVDKGGRSSGVALCEECGLSESSLESIQAGRAEYARVLEELGFLSGSSGATDPRVAVGAAACREPASSLPGSAWLAAPANRNAANARFVKAALCAGFYPSVLRVQHPPTKYKEVHGGTEEAEADPRDVKFFDRERGRVFIHPGSLLFTVGKFESGWLVYTQMTETSKLFVREASMVPVYGMLLFGGELTMEHTTGRLWVDGWAEFKASAQVGVMVRQLRDEMDRLLGAKINDPELPLETDPLVLAVEQLLSSDGF
ncbi:hypothetical protein Vafri_19646 [Volvox africanus]|uniref:ATP-dependent RNA helicase n=1 Tax=Volvox africanus TaxID=51714 RepID=A0A8J4FD43_9CHLO|nr:hypothetical protein Vafri_19646 [Volvox africanus]